MTMKLKLAVSAFALIAICAPLSAQSGCFQSPEAPTDVLLAVGAAGMFYGSAVVGKWLRGRRGR
jgi:XrtJ-associated TM-motif-TM protein